MTSLSQEAVRYMAYAALNIVVAREVNVIVTEPYMVRTSSETRSINRGWTCQFSAQDEPFHIPQAQAYCRGEWNVWDPKITTPPGLYDVAWHSVCRPNMNVFVNRYLLSVVFKRIFLFRCTVGVLRFTNVLLSLALPPLLSRLFARLRRVRPPQSLLEPTTESLVISLFPIAWFFSFLYYTETGSLIFVLACLLASLESQHILAALVCRNL